MDSRPQSFYQTWLLPILGLLSLALITFVALYAVDLLATGGPATDAVDHDPLLRYFFFDQTSITDAVSALGGLVAGVLGIVISVVSIVVQLSAERYTGVTTPRRTCRLESDAFVEDQRKGKGEKCLDTTFHRKRRKHGSPSHLPPVAVGRGSVATRSWLMEASFCPASASGGGPGSADFEAQTQVGPRAAGSVEGR